MTSLLYFAAFLAIALGAAHSWLGEKYILLPLFRRDNLPRLFGSVQFTTRTLRFAWHVTTIAWWGFAALLVQLAGGGLTQSSVANVLGYTFIASGLLPLFITRGKHWSWVVMFAIAGIALFAVAN